MNISIFDHTSWVWPRQSYFFQDCLPKLIFMLNSSYSIKVGSNVIETHSYTPYSHCQNAKFLVRVWKSASMNKTDCIEVDWITSTRHQETQPLSWRRSYRLAVGLGGSKLKASLFSTHSISAMKNLLTRFSLTFPQRHFISPTPSHRSVLAGSARLIKLCEIMKK